MIVHISLRFAHPCACLALPCKSSVLSAKFQLVQRLFTPIKPLNASQVPSVHQQVSLNGQIERAFRRKTWGKVDLDKPGFQIGIQQDVEAKDFKAVKPVHVILFHGLEYIVIATGQRLQDDVVDAGPH